MKTSDELWRWIWEDDALLDEGALADLLEDGGGEAPPPPASPAIRTEDLWEWLHADEPLLEEDPLGQGGEWPVPSGEASVEAPAAPPVGPEPEPEPEPVPAPRRGRTLGRGWRFAALLLVVALAGAVAPQVLPAVVESPEGPGTGTAPPPEQTVVAWSVVDDRRGFAFVAVLAAGVLRPVVLAVPGDVTINLPGQGLGTIREAAVTGDRRLVAVALENLLGVPVDGSVLMTTEELATAVDGGGPLDVADQAMDGAAVVGYLTALEAGEIPDERFLRWQAVLDAQLRAVTARPGSAAAFPEPLAPVLAASSPEPADLVALPVIELGAGLLRPDEEGLDRLVEERFVPLEGDEIRLVVLNGVGEPGIGEEVARILIPHGFRLMSSENANRFDHRVTKIVAASQEDLPAAEQARDLLGGGQILLGAQSQLADVIVVVGQDFAGGR